MTARTYPATKLFLCSQIVTIETEREVGGGVLLCRMMRVIWNIHVASAAKGTVQSWTTPVWEREKAKVGIVRAREM